MKRTTILTAFAAAAITALVFTGCNKSDDDQGHNNANQLKWKANGTLIEADQEINAWGASKANISGRKGPQRPTMAISTTYPGTTGTFDIAPDISSFLNFQDADGALYYIRENLGHGTLTITAVNDYNGQKVLTGTFEGTAYTLMGSDSVVISEGSFYATTLQ